MDEGYLEFEMDEDSDEFDLIVLTDTETGESTEFVVIEGLEYEGATYLLVIAREEFDDECPNAAIVKGMRDENGEYIYVTVDDDEEFEKAAEMFEIEADAEEEDED